MASCFVLRNAVIWISTKWLHRENTAAFCQGRLQINTMVKIHQSTEKAIICDCAVLKTLHTTQNNSSTSVIYF